MKIYRNYPKNNLDHTIFEINSSYFLSGEAYNKLLEIENPHHVREWVLENPITENKGFYRTYFYNKSVSVLFEKQGMRYIAIA